MCSVLCVHMDPRVQARRVDSGFKAKLLAIIIIINKQQSFAKVEGGEDLTWGGGGLGASAPPFPPCTTLVILPHSIMWYCLSSAEDYTAIIHIDVHTYIHTYSLLCSPIHMALMTHRDTCCQQSDATNQC